MLVARGWLRAAMLTALVALAFPAAAAHVEVQAGRSYMDSFGANAFFAESLFTDHRFGGSHLTWAPDVSAGWIEGRDIARYRGSFRGTRESIWLLAAGARFHYGESGDWYQPLFFSFQPALQSGRSMALSGSLEFVSTLGWQGRRFSLQVRHVSDGGLRDPNRGETMVLLGVGFDL